MYMQRTKLVLCDNFPFTNKKLLEEKQLTPDTFEATKLLEQQIKAVGGIFVLNTCFRSWAKQQSLVDLHKKDSVKNAFAAPPGGSYHQAGRSLDVNIKTLNFPGVVKEKWLEKLWAIALPLGFRPIINSPDMNESEAWHFDFLGPWKAVRDKVGNVEAAKCAILDVGNWNPNETPQKIRNMFIQAQLLRLGHYEIGKVDGSIGPKSLKAIKDLGIVESDLDKVAQWLIKK